MNRCNRSLILMAGIVVALDGCRVRRSNNQQIASGLVATGDSFAIEIVNSRFLRGTIPFSYVNRTPTIVGAPTCQSVHGPVLETMRADDWKLTYGNILLMCDGPPLFIPPGGTYAGSLRIGGCLRGFNCAPTWEADTTPAQARLVWRLYRVTRRVEFSSELQQGEKFLAASPPFRLTIASRP